MSAPASSSPVRTTLRAALPTAIAALLAALVCTAFQHALLAVTDVRVAHGWLVWLLPFAGLGLGMVWSRVGEPIGPGTNLVIHRARGAESPVPRRMAAMSPLGTLVAHLFGASVGREGVAVQVGASLADGVARVMGRTVDETAAIVRSGAASGFAALFGTPFAAVILAHEMTGRRRPGVRHLPLTALAAAIGTTTSNALGIPHMDLASPAIDGGALDLARAAILGVLLGLTARAFLGALHSVKARSVRRGGPLPRRLFLAGALVAVLSHLLGAEYLGLGGDTIVAAIRGDEIAPDAFVRKLLLTVVSVGAGFPGGEVTPLFFVGATLGNAAGAWLGMGAGLGAACGLGAVFGAAAGVPIAMIVMSIELLGWTAAPWIIVAGLVAAGTAGRTRLWEAQRSDDDPRATR